MEERIKIDSKLKSLLPNLQLGGLSMKVNICDSSVALQNEITDTVKGLDGLTAEQIRENLNIKSSKDAYRILGKDPNRYRPSSESLLRRVASGKGLYQINNVVDLLNLISINTGMSICGYDADKVIGNVILGIGDEDEPYEGIGRGVLNIEKLPVFRDVQGAFGTPTSDSKRTMVTESTKEFVMIFIDFYRNDSLDDILVQTGELYKLFVGAIIEDKFII